MDAKKLQTAQQATNKALKQCISDPNMQPLASALVWAIAVPSMSPPPRDFWLPTLQKSISSIESIFPTLSTSLQKKLKLNFDQIIRWNKENATNGKLDHNYLLSIVHFSKTLPLSCDGIWSTVIGTYASMIQYWLADLKNHLDSIEYTLPHLLEQAEYLSHRHKKEIHQDLEFIKKFLKNRHLECVEKMILHPNGEFINKMRERFFNRRDLESTLSKLAAHLKNIETELSQNSASEKKAA